MDELEQRILTEFSYRGFVKNSNLSDILGVGERTIYKKVNSMLNQGTIKIIALPNPVLFGYKAWTKIGIKVDPKQIKYVAGVLAKNPSVYFVAYAFGRFDIIIAVHFQTTDQLTYFINSELTRINGVKSVETWIFAYPRKYYNFCWDSPVMKSSAKSRFPIVQTSLENDKYEIDEIDLKILNILTENALIRPAGLKSQLGIGELTIRKHIKNMLDKGVYKIEVVPNPDVLIDEIWATIGVNVVKQNSHEVIDNIIRDSSIYLASTSIGRFDILLSGRFHNINCFYQYIISDLAKIVGISNMETFLHYKPIKYHNVVWTNGTTTHNAEKEVAVQQCAD